MDDVRDLAGRVEHLAKMLGVDEDGVLGRALELGVAVLEGAAADPDASEIIVSVREARVTGAVTRSRQLAKKRPRRTKR